MALHLERDVIFARGCEVVERLDQGGLDLDGG